MELRLKDWLDIYSRAVEIINDPVLILDSSFEVLYSNQQANSHFYIDELSLTLDQIFAEETAKQLTDEIGPVLFSNTKKTISDFDVINKIGGKDNFELIINPIEIENEKITLLTFAQKSKSIPLSTSTYLSISSTAQKEISNNKLVQSVLDQIKPLVPFTIIGLKKIQTLIDTFETPIWIKDNQLKLIAVNKAFLELYNIDNDFAIGKKHETFLPPYLSIILNAVDEYQRKCLEVLILNGYVKKINNEAINQSYFQIPIKDNRSNLYIIIGLINDENVKENPVKLEWKSLNEFISNSKEAIALVDYSKIVEQANSKFCKILGKRLSDIKSKSFIDFFPYLISENINSFIIGENNNDEFYIDKEFNPTEDVSSFAKVSLIKIDVDENSKKFLMVIDDSEKIYNQENELQNIINNRGKMFEVLIQNNPDPIFIYDKENLKFLEVNEAAIKFYGYSRDEFLQMDLTDLYAPDDIQTLLDSFGEGTPEGKYSKPFRHRRKDGTMVIVEVSKTSFRFNDKEAHFNIVKDITATVEKEKQNQMLKIIFNSTDSLVLNTDATGFISFINYPVIEKLGYTSNELMQSSFASIIVDEDRAFVNTTIFQPNLKDGVTLTTKIKKQDGEFLEAEITASPILDFNNEVESFTIVIKPVQYLVTKEVPREIVKEVIKEVVVEKPLESKTSGKILDTSFFSGMFHEILTPMNVIIGFSQELLSGIENPTEEQKETAEIINQNRIKLMDTMNAVVDYSEISQDKFKIELEEISITDIVDKLDKNIKEITGINEIQFSYGKISSSLKFTTDKQKFENLIFLLIKVISRISKDKKVYFSAYPLNDEYFVIGISDQYNNSSKEVIEIFDHVFNEAKDPKDFGLPKFSTFLANVLLGLLGGKYHKSITGSQKGESGFVFSSTVTIPEIGQNRVFVEDVEETTRVESQLTSDISIEQQEHETASDSQVDQTVEEEVKSESFVSEVENEKEEFKPVNTISEELRSKIEEQQESEILTEQEIKSETEEAESISPSIEEPIEVSQPEVVTEETTSEPEPEPTFVPPVRQLNLAELSCLYIEDQVDSQILFKVQMKGLKDVRFAASFEESQSLLLKYKFDFLVIDINLQGEYNGLDALKIIKTMPALSGVPVIAVTAYVLPGDKEKFIAAGFDDFISKPIFREKMMESLEKIFLTR